MEDLKKNSSCLPIKVKMAYATGEIGKNSIILMNNYFLLYFYTDVIRIPAAVAATIMLVIRIWDTIINPTMGIICDKTNSKEGKCRFYLKYFSVPTGICLFLSFFCPELNSTWKIVWVTVTYLLQGTASVIMTIPINTLVVRLTDNKYERVSLSQYKGVLTMIPSLLIPSVTLPLANILGGVDIQKGFAWVAAIYSAICVICFLICFWGTKGYERTNNDELELEKSDKNKLELKAMMGALVKNEYAVIITLAYILFLLYASIEGNSLVYYVQYNMENTGLMAMYTILMNIAGIIPIIFMKKLVKKFGNSLSTVIGCSLVVLGEAIRLVTMDQYTSVIMVGWFLEGIGTGLVGSMLFQCMYDSMVYGEWKSGVNIEAFSMSILSFGQQFGSAIGGVIAGFLLSLVPYIPKAEVQAQKVLNLFFIENIAIPMGTFILLAALFLYISKLEKKLPEMKIEINERKRVKTENV